MGRVTDELISLIERQIKDKGIVVWYDPDRCYESVVESLKLPGASILRYKDSFFELREQLEPYLEFVISKGRPKPDAGVPPRLVIYVPKAIEEAVHALVEAEAAGAVMGPETDHWQLNTSLRVIAERVFKQIAPDHVHTIAERVDSKGYNLADLDKIADEVRNIGAGAVRLIFGTTSITDVVLKFVASEDYDSEIQSKQALPELLSMFQLELGLALSPGEPLSRVREALRRALLTTDFIAAMPPEGMPKEFAAIELPARPVQIQTIRQLCKSWRNRTDYKEAYFEASRQVETESGIEKLNLNAEALTDLETFPSIEKRLLLFAEERILKGDPKVAIDFAAKRKNSFWSAQEPINQLRWSLLETSARLMTAAARIKAELKTIKKNPAEIVKAYTESISSNDDSFPWCLLDTYHRHLERQYTTFDLEISGEHDMLEQVIYNARQKYMEVVELCAESFTAALEAADFQVKGLLAQGKVFPTLVAPLIKQSQGTKSKTVYILVDAMRFEMGRELLEGLSQEFDVSLQPSIAQLPTITEVGMSALLPGADQNMELVEAGIGKIAIKIGNIVMKDRPTRIKHMRESVGLPMVDLKLNDLMKPSKKLREGIANAAFVLVTSQEIDRRGEEAGDEDEARRYMDEVLDKLRRGIRRLASFGVTSFVITADHGHLFGETIESGMKIDAPGGKTADLHRRVWIGRGGTALSGCVRMPASRLGLGGDLELVFPRSLACFTAKAGSMSYFHGATALQEMVIPVAVIRTRQEMAPSSSQSTIEISMEKLRITTRFFSVTVTYTVSDLFGPEEKRVKMIVKAGKKDVGTAVMAAYGFEEGTQDIILETGKPDAVTLMISDEAELKTISVHVIDAATQISLERLENIPVEIRL